jgi:hypothetical protein
MVDNEPHAVVRLLLKRMESHPEEFRLGNGRWAEWLDLLIPFVTEAERVLLRGPMMQEIHEQVMEELCNGPERRRKEAEESEYERHLAASVRHMKQQQLRVGTLSGDMNPLGVGTIPLSTKLDQVVTTHITGEGPSLKAGIATQPELSLSSSTINAIKKALKL